MNGWLSEWAAVGIRWIFPKGQPREEYLQCLPDRSGTRCQYRASVEVIWVTVSSLRYSTEKGKHSRVITCLNWENRSRCCCLELILGLKSWTLCRINHAPSSLTSYGAQKSIQEGQRGETGKSLPAPVYPRKPTQKSWAGFEARLSPLMRNGN